MSTVKIKNHRTVVKDIRMHYTVAGSGPAIVLIHGWPHTNYGWREVQEKLADKYTVIAPDIRGAGYSDRPETGYDGDNIADDIRTLVKDHLGFEKAVVIGHDWGGVWAYHYAAQFPDEVAGLGIIEMMIPGTGGHEAGMQPKPEGAWFWHMAWHSVPTYPEEMIRADIRKYLDYYYTNFSYNPRAVSIEALNEYERAFSQYGSLRSGLEIYKRFWDHQAQTEAHKKNGKLKMPTIAWGGAALMQDMCFQSMEVLADNVTGGSIPECGHWAAEEQPDFVASEIRKLADATL